MVSNMSHKFLIGFLALFSLFIVEIFTFKRGREDRIQRQVVFHAI